MSGEAPRLYLSKVPAGVQSHGGSFYLTPLRFTPTGAKPWYLDTPLLLKRLQSLLKQMCSEANVKGNFTNHSLRATGATTLFASDVPESLIQKQTGHKSLEALRMYERVTTQQQTMSTILASDKPQMYATPQLHYSTQPDKTGLQQEIPVSDEDFLDNLALTIFP